MEGGGGVIRIVDIRGQRIDVHSYNEGGEGGKRELAESLT